MTLETILAVLGRLHARGLHAAVLAALVMMPTVAAVGYLTQTADPERGEHATEDLMLRPTIATPPEAAGGR